ncbi:MAG: patatin family protein [Lachnospiraceae bacterium]|nr:patatin family protein [Lachnospiraceae bacterium]
MKTGLVLEGGAMRGIYTAGVLDVFLENNIEFNGVAGVSAGAVHGCSYVAKQKGRSIRYYTKYCKDKRFMSWHSFFKTGNIVGTDFCYNELPNKLDKFDNDAFEAAQTDYYVTATNCETGKAELIKCDSLRGDKIHYIRASASMPYVSEIVEIDDKKYLDGGIGDSVPLNRMMEEGYDKIVVVLTRPKGYRKKSELNGLAKLVYRKYPNLVKCIVNRPTMYNNTMSEIEKLEEEGKIIVIRPTVDNKISRTEKDENKIREQYELGVKDAQERLDDIKSFIS